MSPGDIGSCRYGKRSSGRARTSNEVSLLIFAHEVRRCPTDRLPCRITVHAQGVEVFVYNRTPAYDAIVERMMKHELQTDSSKASFANLNGTDTQGRHTNARFRKRDQNPGTETSSEQEQSNESSGELPSEVALTISSTCQTFRSRKRSSLSA